MANILLATPTLSDAATLSSNPTATTAGPVTNLQRLQPTDIVELESTAPYIDVDLGTATAFNFVALFHSNAPTTGSWTITAGASQGASTYSSGSQSFSNIGPDGHIWYLISATQTYRWIRMTMASVTNPFQAGRLFVAEVFQPSVNYQYGVADGYDDDTVLDITDGGNIIPNLGTNRSVIDFTLNLHQETDRHAAREFSRIQGSNQDCAVITDPEASTNLSDYVYHGLMQNRRMAVQTRFNMHQLLYSLRSL